jgi:hypothetical protein
MEVSGKKKDWNRTHRWIWIRIRNCGEQKPDADPGVFGELSVTQRTI